MSAALAIVTRGMIVIPVQVQVTTVPDPKLETIVLQPDIPHAVDLKPKIISAEDES